MAVLRFNVYERTRLRKIARFCKSGSVLDLGYAQCPNPYFRGLHRTGVDLVASRGKPRYEEELIGDVSSLEGVLGLRTFDYISAGEIIEHLERPYDFLRSLRQFIKPDGRLILSTPNPVSWPCVFFEWLGSPRFYYSEDHLYYFTPRWVKRMLERAGYRLEKMQGVGLLAPLLTLPSPVPLAYQVIYVARVSSPQTRPALG